MMHGHLCARRRAACVRSWDRGRTPVLSPRPFCPQFYGRINPLSLSNLEFKFFTPDATAPQNRKVTRRWETLTTTVIIPGWMCSLARSLPLKIDQKGNDLLKNLHTDNAVHSSISLRYHESLHQEERVRHHLTVTCNTLPSFLPSFLPCTCHRPSVAVGR